MKKLLYTFACALVFTTLQLGSAFALYLSPEDQEIITQINERLNAIDTMGGQFVQISSKGVRSSGSFVMDRPGKVRFKYDPPNHIEIVSNGKSVVMKNVRLRTQDLWPLNKTPLRHLLAENINLLATNIRDFHATDALVTITIVDNTPIGEGTVTLIFNRENLELTQWTVIDPKKRETSIAIYELQYGLKIDPRVFKVKSRLE